MREGRVTIADWAKSFMLSRHHKNAHSAQWARPQLHTTIQRREGAATKILAAMCSCTELATCLLLHDAKLGRVVIRNESNARAVVPAVLEALEAVDEDLRSLSLATAGGNDECIERTGR